MTENQLIESLNERIKELTCLYEISNIAAQQDLELDDQLQSVVQYLPKAWKHVEDAVAELNYDSKFYFSDILPEKPVSLKHVITIGDKERGYIAIHYDANEYQYADFLNEERVLLKTLAQEVGRVIERYEQRERESYIQRKIQHSDRLAILGEITAGIAHELNTPLGNILGFAQLINENTRIEQIKSDSEKIINSTMHAREVVKKLMFFSCEMPQHMEESNINLLIEEALDLLRVSLRNAEIEVIFKKDQHDILAKIDPIQFTQVIFNLVINAIHASDAGQKIIISLASTPTAIQLSIEDYGHGIEPGIKEKIFEPFFSTKSVGEGSGLGLSVVHGIVKSHGGKIVLHSEPNKGARFDIEIPRR